METIETIRYTGWLMSNNFIKRTLAVLGYGMVGQLIIMVPLIAVIVVLGTLFGWE